MQKGLLVVWTDAREEGENHFNEWYNREHLHERVGVPGFLNGARYAAVHGAPRYFAVYDTEIPEVLSGAAYLERLNHPTPWTLSAMPLFENTVRTACRTIHDSAGDLGGRSLGGVMLTCRMELSPTAGTGARKTLRETLSGPLADRLMALPGLLRVRIGETMEDSGPEDAARKNTEEKDGGGVPVKPTARDTAETALRGPDRTVTFVLLLEAAAEPELEGISTESIQSWIAQSQPGASQPGAQEDLVLETGIYRLLYGLPG